MGRRKIEIKAIKDDRNRSVTFLKRKGGLFKKAHELSVLCSVDVAVIIFGSNKKLYEYSSCDISEVLQRYNYYGQPNEHKGPADFNGKKDDDDDDDDEVASQQSHRSPEPPSMLPPQFQNQPHIRHHTPSASPPIANGGPFNVQRQLTPQPQHASRPSSRNAPHRPTSNLAQHPMNGPGPAPPHTYAYMQPPPSMPYAPHPQGIPQAQMQPGPPHHVPMQHPHMQQMPMQAPMHHHMQGPPPQNYQYPPPPAPQHHPHPPPHTQLHVQYVDEQRRSMPPSFQQTERLMPSPQPPQQRFSSPQPAPLQTQLQEISQVKREQPMPAPQQQSRGMLQPVKRMSKSRSIFTPIDESRSILSQHWASSTSSGPDAMGITHNDLTQRTASTQVMSNAGRSSPAPSALTPRSQPQDKPTPPLRTGSAFSTTKRPILTLAIPDEPSPSAGTTGGSGTGASSPPGSTATATDGKAPNTETSSHSSGVVLPPPSPSTHVASAGATGPLNPFARPHPPNTTNTNNTNTNTTNTNRDINMKDSTTIETPHSALPSRFMSNEFLPSPSSFFGSDWNFRGEGNTLPSPMTFQTPILGGFNSFLRDDGQGTQSASTGLKRKSPEMADGEAPAVTSEMKRIKGEE